MFPGFSSGRPDCFWHLHSNNSLFGVLQLLDFCFALLMQSIGLVGWKQKEAVLSDLASVDSHEAGEAPNTTASTQALAALVLAAERGLVAGVHRP